MTSRTTKVAAATAIALSIGAFAAPAASAATTAPEQSAQTVGSVAVCLNIPFPPPFSVSICL